MAGAPATLNFRSELRSAIRYQLAAPVSFSWKSQSGELLRAEGVTRDISVRGAFILTPYCPGAGTTVRVEIFFGGLQPFGRSMTMVTHALVVRMEHSILLGPLQGFAVCGEGFAIPELASRR